MRTKHEAAPMSCASRYSGDEDYRTHGSVQRSTKVHTSFRISPVVEMIANCCSEKQLILRKMNFHGLMHLPKGEGDKERPFKLQFAKWLLIKFDHVTNCLKLGKRGNIPIRIGDVGSVLGLPTEGEELDEPEPASLEHNKAIIKKNLMLEDHEEIDLANIKKVLQRRISNDEHGALRRAFITAVAIYTVSYFLAPRSRPPKVNTDIFQSIADTNRIFKLNWSSYVLKTLRESSAKIKCDIEAGNSSVCLDGCLLFLQIIYLEKLQCNKTATNAQRLPRVADYSYELLKKLIDMDKFRPLSKDGEQYGKMELKHQAEDSKNAGIRNQKPSASRYNASYQMNSDIMEILDKQNSMAKDRIIKASKEMSEQFCKISDMNCYHLKTVVATWISQNNSTNTAPKQGMESDHSPKAKNEGNKNAMRQNQGSEYTKGTENVYTTPTNNHQTKQSHQEVVDISESEDDDYVKLKRQKLSRSKFDAQQNSGIGMTSNQVLGIRCGTKRAANRTPLAVRRRQLEEEKLKGPLPQSEAHYCPVHMPPKQNSGKSNSEEQDKPADSGN